MPPKGSSNPKRISLFAKWDAKQRIAFNIRNPKVQGGSAFERYQRYKHTKTIQEALDNGACLKDLEFDYQKGYLRKSKPTDVRNAFKYAVSLGSKCIVAEVLRGSGLRRFSCPFDWLYSSGEMVEHCLKDNFATYLDTTQMVKSGVNHGHKHYSKMLGRGVIYPHHNPKKEIVAFTRRVQRFRAVMRSKKRTLFVMFNLVESVSGLQEAREDKGKEFQDVFKALQKKGVKSFELLAVNVLCGKASDAGSKAKEKPKKYPVVKDTRCGLKNGQSLLSVYDFHCVGECTGLRLKQPKDKKALGDLVNGQRKFDLDADPLIKDDAKKQAASLPSKRQRSDSGAFSLHPKRTVKRLKDGSYLTKEMD